MIKTKIKTFIRKVKLNKNIEKWIYMIIKKYLALFLFIMFLFYSNMIPFWYYKIKQSLLERNIKHKTEVISSYKSWLKNDIVDLECINSQLQRIVENKVIKLWYCN